MGIVFCIATDLGRISPQIRSFSGDIVAVACGIHTAFVQKLHAEFAVNMRKPCALVCMHDRGRLPTAHELIANWIRVFATSENTTAFSSGSCTSCSVAVVPTASVSSSE